jgi:hypothetical protein
MLGFRLRLGMTDEVQDFLAMLGKKIPAQRQLSGRNPVVYPLARGTEMLFGLWRRLSPPPLPVMNDRATLGASSRLRPLAPRPIGIANTLFIHAIPSRLVTVVFVFLSSGHGTPPAHHTHKTKSPGAILQSPSLDFALRAAPGGASKIVPYDFVNSQIHAIHDNYVYI